MRRRVAVRWAVLLTASAFASAIPVATASGGDAVPVDGVATVDGVPITNDVFAHWMTVAAISQQGDPSATVPVPPDFTACVQAAKASPAKAKKRPTAAQLKASCLRQYNELRGQALEFLISAQWIIGEAGNRGIGVTDQQVQAEYVKQKKASYPKEADFRKFLRSSGMTVDDLLQRVKVDMLSTALRDTVIATAAKPTPAQVKAYYARHKHRLRKLTRRQATSKITRLLTQQNQEKALEAFVKAFQATWKARTDCRSGYVVALCANAAKP